MPAIIRKGQTKQATFLQNSGCVYNDPGHGGFLWEIAQGNPAGASQNGNGGYTNSAVDPARDGYTPPWNITSGGVISVPATTPLSGLVTSYYQGNVPCSQADYDQLGIPPVDQGYYATRSYYQFIIGCLPEDPSIITSEATSAGAGYVDLTIETPGVADNLVSFTWYRGNPTGYNPDDPGTYGDYVGSTRTITNQPIDFEYTCVISLNECYEFEPGWEECYPLCEEVTHALASEWVGVPGWSGAITPPTEVCPGDLLEVGFTEIPLSGTIYATSDVGFTTGLGAVALTENPTPTDETRAYNYTFAAHDLAPGTYKIRFNTSVEVENEYIDVEFSISDECEPPEPVHLEVTIEPAAGCPGDLITVTSSHALTSAVMDVDGVDVVLPLTPLGENGYTFLIPAEVEAADIYNVTFTTDAEIDTTTDAVDLTVGEECFEAPPEPCVPPAPAGCWEDIETLHIDPIAVENFPACTDTLSFEINEGDGWNEAAAGIIADQEFTVEVAIGTNVKGRFKADDGTVSTETIFTEFCPCEGGDPPVDPDLDPPAIPAPPTLAKDCLAEKITIEAPAFSDVENAEATSIKIRRRLAPDGEWAEVHTFEAAGTFDDEGVSGGLAYEYSAAACNAAGCSDWSAVAAISLISATATVAFQSPAADSELRRNVDILFAAEDSGGEIEEPKLFANGVQLFPLELISGDGDDGVYHCPWNTRRFWEGAVTLRAQVRGSDGCLAIAEREFTVANTQPASTLYRDDAITLNKAGQRIVTTRVSVETGPLDAADSGRFWCEVGARKNELDPVTDETPQAQADEEWATHQKFPMETRPWPARGLLPAGALHACRRTLNQPGDPIYFRRKLTPALHLRLFTTGLDIVERILEIEEGRFWCFARNEDGSAASVWEYDGASFAQKFDLVDWLAEGATAFSKAHDGVLAALPGGLLLIDIAPLTEPRDAAITIRPRLGREIETRPPKHLVPLDADGARVLVLHCSSTSTQAYLRWSGGMPGLWSLNVAITLAKARNGKVLLAAGERLYVSSDGLAAPTLVGTFLDDIAALDENRVVLANGELWELAEGEWSLVTTLPGGAHDLELWTGSRENEFAVAAGGDAWLRWPDRNGTWADGVLVEAPADVEVAITKITCLARYHVEIESDEPAIPGAAEPEPTIDERILFGADGGVFGEISLSKLSEADGAFLCTGQEAIVIIPTWRKTPVEE